MILTTQTVRFLKYIIVAALVLLATNYVRTSLMLYNLEMNHENLATSGNSNPFVEQLTEIDPHEETRPEVLALCPEKPPNLGPISANKLLQLEETDDVLVELEPGGAFRPSICQARQRVAIIIPDTLKDSMGPTMTFMYVLHNLLMKQQMDYRIFVVQAANRSDLYLSRGLLMNIGFLVAEQKRGDWECFIFHTPGVIPTDSRNLYRCAPDHVRQLVSSITDFSYIYENNKIYAVDRKRKFGKTTKVSFGQVMAITKEMFLRVNGFSNRFYPNDGEFGDMRLRLKYANLHFKRSPAAVTRYVRLNNTKFHINEIPSYYYEREQMEVTMKPQPESPDGISTIPVHTQSQDILYMYTSIEVDPQIAEISMQSGFKSEGKFLRLL